MELYQLEIFLAVAETGNLSRAAKMLAISQPAVSAQVKSLEDELGVAVFERTPRGMSLTHEGAQLLAEARTVLSTSEHMLLAARRLRNAPEGRVRMGALPDPETLRLGEVLTVIGERFPRIQIELRHASSVVTRSDLLAGHLDCGFILGPSEPPLQRLSLRPIGLAVAVPAQSAIGDGSPWAAVAALPWIGTPPGCPFQVLSQELFRRLGRAPEVRLQVDIEHTIVESVAAGLGASLLREDTAKAAAAAGKCRIWPGATIESELAFVWARDRDASPALDAVRTVVARLWSKPA